MSSFHDESKDKEELTKSFEIFFDILDVDGDGKLDTEEIFNGFEIITGYEISKKEAKEVIKMADVDGDGKLDIDEFIKFLHIHHKFE